MCYGNLGYEDWFLSWASLCARKLKPNGVLYFWHNDIGQLAKLLVRIRRGPHMLRHYFRDSQFEIPTREVWDAVYEPLGFDYQRRDTRGCEEYEGLRNYHRCDARHCNVWRVSPIPSAGRLHICQKPVEILERSCLVSCPEGGIVLDPFMGSGRRAWPA